MTQEPIQQIIKGTQKETPYGALKTAELDVQFSLDPTFGLTSQQFGWYSDDVFFDSSYFSEVDGRIQLETPATTDSSARLRSAFPGQYISHTVSEPGMGLSLRAADIERDADNLVSLTHGEISAEIVEWDNTTDSGVTAHGISFESDATYVQIRRNDSDIEKVPQEDWNIDPLDGTGPSDEIFRPEDGYVYNFPFTWYGQGALYLTIENTRTGEMLPLHRAEFSGSSIDTPNLPVQVTVENKGTADSLQCDVGGMQYATHGSDRVTRERQGRTTEITRRTASGYIDATAVFNNEEVDPFAEPGMPLVAARRDLTSLDSRVSLSVNIVDAFLSSDSNTYLFVFDEFDDANALTNENFRESNTVQNSRESNLQVDTSATDYTPGANASLRGISFVTSGKQQAVTVAGDARSRLPIDATAVVTVALQPGENNTEARPGIFTVREGF